MSEEMNSLVKFAYWGGVITSIISYALAGIL